MAEVRPSSMGPFPTTLRPKDGVECVCPQEDSLTLKKLARHVGAWQPAKMVSGLGFPSSLSTLIMYQMPKDPGNAKPRWAPTVVPWEDSQVFINE